MRTFHTRDGRQVDESTALDGQGCVKDGYSIRSKATLMDGAMPLQRDTFKPMTDDEKSDAIEARNARLSDAWRNPPSLADTAPVAAALGDTEDVYARHDRRLQDAWRQTA